MKYYENTQCADESESDVLLSYDEEAAMDGTAGSSRQVGTLVNGGVPYSLLMPTAGT